MSVRTVQLEEVAAVFNGKTPSKAEQRHAGHPVLKIKDVDDAGRFVGRFDSFVDPDLAAALAEKAIQKGDTLILNAAHNAEYVASKSFFAHGSAVGALATGEWLLLRPLAEQADARFIYFWSQHSETRKRLSNLVKGIHLYPKDVAELPIPLPALCEQKRVADLLEQAGRLRRTRRHALELSDSFLPAVFLELFGDPVRNTMGWPVSELEDLASVERGKFTPRPRNDPSYFGGQFPFIQTGDISNSGGLLRFWTQTINEKGIKVSRSFPRGTIVVAIVGATIGASAILETEVYCPDSVVGIQVDRNRATKEYIEFLLRFWRPVFLSQAPETARANINLETLRPLRVALPPLQLQNYFAALVERHKHLRARQREALRQADHLFESLLQRSFG